ncbi:TetR family transcriptional regulator [Rhodospirillaceae bacterium RKSG073]|nr:TetR family transcriptional regulator [Curvivirga aplysinae]
MNKMTIKPEVKKPSRSRAANKAFRRQQLIDATLDCIDEVGFAGTTLAKVATKAGLSQGIVIFHFKSKEILFEETLRYMTSEYRNTLHSALSKSPDEPIDRLCTMIRTDFDPKICNEKKIGIWHAFWGEAKAHPLYKELYNDVDIEFGNIIETECEKLSASPTAKMDGHSAMLTIESMINGLWNRYLLTPQRFDRKKSLNATLDIVSSIYPDCVDQVEIYKRRLK